MSRFMVGSRGKLGFALCIATAVGTSIDSSKQAGKYEKQLFINLMNAIIVGMARLPYMHENVPRPQHTI